MERGCVDGRKDFLLLKMLLKMYVQKGSKIKDN